MKKISLFVRISIGIRRTSYMLVHVCHALITPVGVTEENLEEVRWCIRTSPLEKSARKAAKGLFQAINPLSPNTALLQSLDKAQRKLVEKACKTSISFIQVAYVYRICRFQPIVLQRPKPNTQS